MFFLFIVVLFVGYVTTGITIAATGFYNANRQKTLPDRAKGWTEQRLMKQWSDKKLYPSITSTPNITLKEFYAAQEEVSTYKTDAIKAHAYRRMFWSPVWPLLLAGDVYRGYQKAKAGERVYLLEQSTKALEKAMTDKPDLDKAYAKAQEALEKATVK